MEIGTKSVLFGAHCFLVHPWFVAAAWWKLYGFPWNPRLWFAFFLHDLGYVGSPNMDGPEGEQHTEWAAEIMHILFDQRKSREWYNFCKYHSRFLSKQHNRSPSRLCFADKLGIAYTPFWLYIPMTTLSGEINEYMELAKPKEGNEPKYAAANLDTSSKRKWYKDMQNYAVEYSNAHKDGEEDMWTPK